MKRFSMFAAAAMFVCGFAFGAGPHYKHLRPMEWMIGDWVGHATLDQDIPGFGEKGDPVEIAVSLKWRANKNVIVMESIERKEDKEIDGLFITVEWDAEKKQVVTSLTNGIGDRWHGVLEFTGGDNHETTSRVVSADGTVANDAMVVVLERIGKNSMKYIFENGSSIVYKRK